MPGTGEHRELDDAGLPADPRLRGTLGGCFRWATWALARYPDSRHADVPAGQRLPRWSWDGPVTTD